MTTHYRKVTRGYTPVPGIESILFGGNYKSVKAEVDRSLREALTGRVGGVGTQVKDAERRPMAAPPKEGRIITGADIVGTSHKSQTQITGASKLTPVQKAYLEADRYLRQNDWKSAAEALEQVLRLGPDESLLAWMNTLLGIAYFSLNDHARAADAFRKSIENNPGNGAGYFYLGTLYMMEYMILGKFEELNKAIGPFKKAIGLKHHRPQAYFYLGYVYGELQDWERAEDAYKRAIRAQKGFKAAYLNLARLYSAWALSEPPKRDVYLRKAIDTFEELAKIESHDSETYNYIGYLYTELDEAEGAINAFKRAIEADPENALAVVNLATAYLGAQRHEEARQLLRQLIERDEGAVKSYLMRVTEEAEDKFHLFMDEVNQKLGVACLNIYLAQADEEGEVAADSALLEEAGRAFKTAISLNPHDAHAHIGLGVVYYRQNQIERAAEHFRKALEISPGDEDALGNLEALRQHIGNELRNAFRATLRQGGEGEEVTTEDLIRALSEARDRIFDDEGEWERLGLFGSRDLLEVLMPFAEKSATPEGRVELAVKLYARRWLSFDDAARLANLGRELFLEYLYHSNIPVHDPEVAYLPPPSDPSAAIALLQSWYDEDPQEQQETLGYLRVVLDEDRLSDRKLFS